MIPAGPRSPWVGVAAVALLLAGLALAVAQWRRVAPSPPVAIAPDTSEAAIGRALGLAPMDSAAYKSRWLDEVRGLEYADLDSSRRELFLRFANAQRCDCGCGYTIATCLESDMTCEVSRPRAQALLDSVRAGLIRSARGVRSRPD